MCLIAAGVAWQFRPNAGDLSPLNTSTIERPTYDSGWTTMPALSPDRRLVAYASDRAGRWDRDIWVQQVGGGVPLRVTDDPADDIHRTSRRMAVRSCFGQNGPGAVSISCRRWEAHPGSLLLRAGSRDFRPTGPESLTGRDSGAETRSTCDRRPLSFRSRAVRPCPLGGSSSARARRYGLRTADRC